MSKPFAEPVRALGSEPSETPYQRARQEWDRRMGAAVLSARAWRMMAIAGLGLVMAPREIPLPAGRYSEFAGME